MTAGESADANGEKLGPASPRHLAHAPISEALIDFRAQLEEGFSVETLDVLTRQVEREYPTRNLIRTLLTRVEVGGTVVKPNVERGELGYIVKAPDQKTQAQFRLDGFTLNRLEPYTSWTELYPETIRLWRLYTEVAKPKAVVRLAARYINRLKFPLPLGDLRDYLVAPPQVPERLPQVLRAYLTRIVIHHPSLDLSAIVTQSFEPNPVDAAHITILLDIDAFKDVVFKPTQQDDIDRVLNRLHIFKNDIFFGSITQKASEFFE